MTNKEKDYLFSQCLTADRECQLQGATYGYESKEHVTAVEVWKAYFKLIEHYHLKKDNIIKNIWKQRWIWR